MAKKSSIEKNERRKRMAKGKAETRAALKAIIMNREAPFEERMQAQFKLAKLPRNSAKVRIRNRCELSGRARGYHRKLRLSRIALRDLASRGELPGVIKSSW